MTRRPNRKTFYVALLAAAVLGAWFGYELAQSARFDDERDRILSQVVAFRAEYGRYPVSDEDRASIRYDQARVPSWFCADWGRGWKLFVDRPRLLEREEWTYDFDTGEWTMHIDSY